MLAQIVSLLAVAALASAGAPSLGYLNSASAIGAQSEHTVRGYGGLSSVSQYTKAVDAPYSSVRKTDTRITNDGAVVKHAYAAHPYVHHGHAAYAAPVHHAHAAPVAYAHHAHPVAPYAHHHAAVPAAYAHHHAAAPIAYAHHHDAAPVAYAHPAAYAHGHHHAPAAYAHHGAYAAPVAKAVAAHPVGALGVAYSPATAVATSSFSGYGISYGY